MSLTLRVEHYLTLPVKPIHFVVWDSETKKVVGLVPYAHVVEALATFEKEKTEWETARKMKWTP